MDHVSFILGILDSRLSKVSSENLIFSLDNKLQQLLALLELDRCVKTENECSSRFPNGTDDPVKHCTDI